MLSIKNFKISLATICISGLTALSLTPSVSAEIKTNCVNPKSNIEATECAYREYQAADKKLNQVYKSIFSSLIGKEKQHLVNAQSNWIKFRDTNCDFEAYESRDTRGYDGFLSNCLERMTGSRTQELQEWKRHK